MSEQEAVPHQNDRERELKRRTEEGPVTQDPKPAWGRELTSTQMERLPSRGFVD